MLFRPAASASPVRGANPPPPPQPCWPTELETLGVGPSSLGFNRPCGWLWWDPPSSNQPSFPDSLCSWAGPSLQYAWSERVSWAAIASPVTLGPPWRTGTLTSSEVRLPMPCKGNVTQKIDQEELKSLWQGLLGSQLTSQLRKGHGKTGCGEEPQRQLWCRTASLSAAPTTGLSSVQEGVWGAGETRGVDPGEWCGQNTMALTTWFYEKPRPSFLKCHLRYWVL